MFFNKPRWTVKAYEDLNFFSTFYLSLPFKKKLLSKEVKKDFDFSEFRVNNPRPDISFIDYLEENF